MLNIFESAWRKISEIALATHGGYTDEDIIKGQFKPYLESHYDDPIVSRFKNIIRERESDKERECRIRRENTAKNLLATKTLPHWNFEGIYESFPADRDISITHGGGFFHLSHFLFGKSLGYKPDGEEGNAPCIYVAPPNYGGVGIETYAWRESPVNFDIPCILTAKIKVQNLRYTRRHPDEALLMKNNTTEMSDITLEIIEGTNSNKL